MRAYILRVLAVSMFTALCKLFLPDGRVRRFAAPVLSLAVTASILVPAVSLFRADIAADTLLPAMEVTLSGDAYEKRVKEEYARRIRAKIEEKGDVTAEIQVGENYEIEKIQLAGTPNTAVMHYITMELEVPRSHVEIR